MRNRKNIIYIGMIFALLFSMWGSSVTALEGKESQEEQELTVASQQEQEVIEEGTTQNADGETESQLTDREDVPLDKYTSKLPGVDYSAPKRISYHSKVTDSQRHARILLPADYDKSKRYPVLYLLHGLNGSDKTWIKRKADVILQNLQHLDETPEMIVVFVNSAVNKEESTKGMSRKEKLKTYDRTGADLVSSLMPYINRHFSTYRDKQHTALAGNSMGGRETLYTAFTHQEKFAYVGAFSSANVIDLPGCKDETPLKEFTIDPKSGGFRLLMLNVGRSDRRCGNVSYQVHKKMMESGIDHEFYDMDGGHETKVWQNGLYNFGKQLFRK